MLKTVKKFVLPLAAVAVMAGCSEEESEVVATVGEAEVTRGELDKLLLSQHGESVLDTLIMNEIVEQEAEKQKLSVSDEEIDAEFATYVESFGGEDELMALIEKYDMTDEDIREDIRVYLLTVKLMEQQVNVTDEDVRAYFEENKAMFATEDAEPGAFEAHQDQARQMLLDELVNEQYDVWAADKREAYDIQTFLFK